MALLFKVTKCLSWRLDILSFYFLTIAEVPKFTAWKESILISIQLKKYEFNIYNFRQGFVENKILKTHSQLKIRNIHQKTFLKSFSISRFVFLG